MSKRTINAIIILLLSIIFFELSLFVSLPLLFSFFIFFLYLAASFLYVTGLKNFTKEVKRVYIVICIGMVLSGMTLFLKLLLPAFGPGDLLFVVALAVIFLSLLQLSRLFNVKNQLISPIFFIPIAALILSIYIAIPSFWFELPPVTTYVLLTAYTVIMILIIYQTIIVFIIRNAAGSLFTKTFHWLGIALLIQSAAAFQLPFLLLSGYEDQIASGVSFFLFYVLSSFCFLKSADAFRLISPRYLFTPPPDPFVPRAADPLSLQIVDYTVTLASNPQNIYFQIEKVKQVEKMQDSPERAKFLLNTYMEIERYLLEKDPVLRFTQEGLRKKIREKFKLESAQDELQSLFIVK